MEVEAHLWKTCIVLCDLTSSPPEDLEPFPMQRKDREEVRAFVGIKVKKKKKRRRNKEAAAL